MKIFSKLNNQQGFTLTELLIAIPLATLLTTVMIGTLFAQYTEVLAQSAKSNLRGQGQSLLINLQDELLFTIAYGEILDVGLVDPHQPSGGWSYNTSPQTLIINEIALDSTRRDSDRHIVRQQLNPCETSPITSNPVALNNVIYFIGDNPDSDFDTLYKRTITPGYALCGIDSVTGDPCTVGVESTCDGNAKTTTCPADEVGTGGCTTKDFVLSENVSDLQIRYFAENNVETSIPSSADMIEVTMTLADRVYGKDVTVDVKHTIRKVN